MLLGGERERERERERREERERKESDASTMACPTQLALPFNTRLGERGKEGLRM